MLWINIVAGAAEALGDINFHLSHETIQNDRLSTDFNALA